MDSENDGKFPSGQQDALNLDDEVGFKDSESVDDPEDDDDVKKQAAKPSAAPAQKEIKGEKLDNQPYDLAVDVNDSEEIDSEEEDDEVNMNDVQQRTAQSNVAPNSQA